MNKEEISKLLKDNPIKIIKFGDIEVPVEYLKQTTVNINGDDYIRLQQENKQLKEENKRLKEELRIIKEHPYISVFYKQKLNKIKELEEGVKDE